MEHELTDDAKFVENDEQAMKNMAVALYMQQQLIGLALQTHQLKGVVYAPWVLEWFELSRSLITSVHLYYGIAAGGAKEPAGAERAGEWEGLDIPIVEEDREEDTDEPDSL